MLNVWLTTYFYFLSNSFYLFKMNYSITRFTGIDYNNGKSAKWDLISERHTQESALAHCKSLNLNQPYYHRVEVNSKKVELPRFQVLKPNMKNDHQPIVIPVSFTVRKKYNFIQRLIRRFFWCPSSSTSFTKTKPSSIGFILLL